MKLRSQVALLMILASPLALQAQAAEAAADEPVELKVILEPGPLVGGVPGAFTFHLLNVGDVDLRIPEPNLDCSNPSFQGSVWLNESWQPSTGDGLATGMSVCDFVGSRQASPPITEIARTWHLLKPGESLYIRTTQAQLHFEAGAPGTYTFSAVYLPPALAKEQEKALKDAGISVPRQKASSASLRYLK